MIGRRANIAGFALLILALGACQEGDPPQPRPSASDRQACEAAGGDYTRGGLLGLYVCYTPTPDGGQQCRSGQDCTGFCFTDEADPAPSVGSCSPVRPVFGCWPILTDEGEAATICID